MNTSNLLKLKANEKGYTRIKLEELIDCSEKTLRNYFNGNTVSGPYLTKILEVLDISVAEWNHCENIIGEDKL